jgi:DNA replication and repair protein RecF
MIQDIQLKRLAVFQFKSYAEAALDFSERVVCLLGQNGEGKTNLLDSIHYLSACKSYFNAIDSQNIQHGANECAITGEFEIGELPELVVCAIRKGQKKVFKRNHKDYERLADHVGFIPSVIITPYDIELILEGSEVRRKFIDSTISQHSRRYLDELITYNHALQQRNNLLKQLGPKGPIDGALLEPWDAQLVHLGSAIHQARQLFMQQFTELFTAIYSKLSQSRETPGINYESDLFKGDFEQMLIKNRERDRFLERTSAGTHRDEMSFTLDGFPLKKFASQGQQKSFLIALKLAQYLLLRDNCRKNPILLLDDLFDKLDSMRVKNLLAWLNENRAGQIFITDTDLHRIPQLLSELNMDHEVWEIKGASATKI